MTEANLSSSESERGRRQVRVGTVTSDKMDKTVVVRVERTVTHRLYKSQMKRSSKFVAHDEANEAREGDVVQLVSTKPSSKRKRWRVQRIVKRAEG